VKGKFVGVENLNKLMQAGKPLKIKVSLKFSFSKS